jgi:hypothetical protein
MTCMTGLTILAYLDPGTGSMVLQLLIGGLLGGAFVIKHQWKRITNFFSKNKDATESSLNKEDGNNPTVDSK